eukprot:Em0011g1116a
MDHSILWCQGITRGQWYEPSGVLFPLATPDPVSTPGDGPNITGGVQFQLLTPTNVDPPVFQLTCTSTSSPPTDVLWTTNGSAVSNTSSQIVTDRPTSTYNNTLTVTGRAYGMYTCTVTTTCSPVCGGFTLNPRSIPHPHCTRSSPPASVLVNTSLAAPSAPPNNLTEVTKTSSSVPSVGGKSPATYSTNGVVNTYHTHPNDNKRAGSKDHYTFSVTAYTITGPGTPLQVPALRYTQCDWSDGQHQHNICPSVLAGCPAPSRWHPYRVHSVLSFSSQHFKEAVGWVHQSHLPVYLHLWDINNLNPNGVYQFSVVAQVNIMGQLYSGVIPSSGSTIATAPSIKEFPSDSDVVDGEEVVFTVRVTGYPRPSFTWYRNGTKMTTDHSFTLGEDGSLVIHTAEMGHAGVYELEVANELGVDRRRVSLGVYGSEIELPGDYQMTVPAVSLAKFGPYVAKSHEKNNTGFNNQYRVSVNGYRHGSR